MQRDAFKTNGSSPPGREPDLLVHGHGSVFLLRPTSSAGSAWIEEHIPADAMRFGGAVAVEHRFIGDIVAGAITDGLEVR